MFAVGKDLYVGEVVKKGMSISSLAHKCVYYRMGWQKLEDRSR